MAMTIVGTTTPVIAGVDTHAAVHVAAAVDRVGGVLGIESFITTEAGCQHFDRQAALPWRREPGRRGGHRLLEAGLTRQLERAGIAVVEVDRPNRQVRRREGKSDPVDAVAAARAVLSGQALGQPKARTGDVEAIRVLMVARRSAASERIAALRQLRHLCFTADDQVRRRFEQLSVAQLTVQAAALRPRPRDTVRYSTLLTMRTLARRVAYLDDELDNLAVVIRPLVERGSPSVLAMPGVGYDVTAGSWPNCLDFTARRSRLYWDVQQ
jgi:transposase